MSNLLPWLAVAGAGALHGLNPATGWLFAAAWGKLAGKPAAGRLQEQAQEQTPGPVRTQERAKAKVPVPALAALAPIAIGHMVSVATVAGTVAAGLAMDRMLPQLLAAALLIAIAALHLLGRKGRAWRMGRRLPGGQVGLALWSFIMSTAHGAGMMLVPALVPLCIANSPAREITATGSLSLALAAVAVHAAAMLAVTGLVGALVGWAGTRCANAVRRKW